MKLLLTEPNSISFVVERILWRTKARRQKMANQMKEISNWNLARFVLLSWTIPFLSSFLFFGPNEETGNFELAIDKNDFKNGMVVLCSLLFSVFITWSITWRDPASVAKVATAYSLGNILLDLIILIPMSGMSLSDYMAEIGALYFIIAFSQVWFGYSLATSNRPNVNSFVGIILRAPLVSLTSYVAISFFYDDKQTKLLVSIWYFRTVMVLITNATVGLNLLKALQQVRDLQVLAFPVAVLFVMVTIGVDFLLINPVFRWSTQTYFAERGFRLLSTCALGVIARGVAFQRDAQPQNAHRE